MKSIQKGREPNSLIEHRAEQTQPYSRNVFDDFAHKDELRECLLQEQGHLLLLLYETDCGKHDED